MNSLNIKTLFLSIAFINLLTFTQIKGQAISKGNSNSLTDSIELNQVLKDVIQNYPSIKAAEEAINSADAKIGLAKSGYFPDIDFTANYTLIEPDFPIPGFGQLFPENNYSANINYRQNLWDFGKTKKNVALENKGKELTNQSINLVKQKLAMTVISNYFALLFLQKAIGIKHEQLSTLNKHLDFVKKKKETGSATEYELISTQVKISNIESQLLDLEGSRTNFLSVINNFLGQPSTQNHIVKEIPNTQFLEIRQDSTILKALQNRDEMKLAQIKIELDEIRLQTVNSQNNPVLSAMFSGGYKNGYIKDLYKFQPNFVAGFGFRFPIFDGTRSKFNKSIVNSTILTSNFEKDIAKRNISNEVVESETNLKVSAKKVRQFEMQLEQANKALSLAEVSYKSGVITNLDLMDATTSVSESQLLLLKSKIDYMISVYKFKMAIGERIY